MSKLWKKQIENERGATIALVAVCLVTLIICAAIAIDLGMLLDSRSESQRATDAAALAAASAFIDYDAPEDSVQMWLRAIDYAGRNTMRGTSIAPSEIVDVELDRDLTLVRVTAQRPEVNTWFANIFGVSSVPVGSRSAARVVGSGSVECLKPFAVHDQAYSPETFGERRMVFDSRDSYFVTIGFGDAEPGLGNIQQDIALKCNDKVARISLADPWVNAKPSDAPQPGMIRGASGPNNLDSGFWGMYNQDRDLRYNEGDGKFYRNGVEEPNWRASPRVGNVAVVAYETIIPGQTGTYQVEIVDFVTVFFENPPQQCGGNQPYCFQGQHTWVYGRFFPAIGVPDNCLVTNTCAPNTFRLRLVE